MNRPKNAFVRCVNAAVSACLTYSVPLSLPLIDYQKRAAETLTDHTPGPLDAAIVFTGSHDRINQGKTLHDSGRARLLLISGVNEIPDTDTSSRNTIFFDRATNTKTNALYSAQWIADNQIKSVVLVTSENHMPRALLELQLLLPESVKIYTSPTSSYNEAMWPDSEQMRTLCRIYESWISNHLFETSFCYESRATFKQLYSTNAGAPASKL